MRAATERRILRGWVAVFLGALLAASPPAAAGERASSETGRSLEMYRGLGTWIDIYDGDLMNHPRRTVRRASAQGVKTIYVETANYHSRRPVMRRSKMASLIEHAHRRGLNVVAWYLPGFRDLDRDFHRSLRAIRFGAARDERFDSFALDIESPLVKNPERRTRRLVRLSARLRREVGRRYTLGAIIPSPKGMQLSPSYWPGFPYERLARKYDVMLPMIYFSWRVSGYRAVYRYTSRCFRILRRETEHPRFPVHAIGGIADETSGREVRAFARAVTRKSAIGAGLYDLGTMGPEDWTSMRRARYRSQ
ncbi:MAG TPA: hypothetical protein VFD47_00185 [Actinomycetota bacterium]|nr:hypothetical protein [Actinomycetota bacterium]